MSIKNLFGKTVKSLEKTYKNVESSDFANNTVEDRQAYEPLVDFSDPKNFAFYGSAELYYEAAIKRIHEDFPYDGSKAEQVKFISDSSFLERWVYDEKYPKTTGFIQLGTTTNITSIVGNYAGTSVEEYIRVWGGLRPNDEVSLRKVFNSSSKYDESKNRTQNWYCNFANGVTIEFYLKKETYNPTTEPREVILDLFNNDNTSTKSRMVLSIFETGGIERMSLLLDNNGASEEFIINTNGLNTSEWKHYAISIIDTDSGALVRFYINGEEQNSTQYSNNYGIFNGKVDGFIGALQEEISPTNGSQYGGKLSAYLDEFRFWKTRRTSTDIKLNWINGVGGGANTDDNTTDIGVYFKFNEGITGVHSIDRKILDYSGRLSNGVWYGYENTSSGRSTDSAIEAAGYIEDPSPIIYEIHSDVVSLKNELKEIGISHDASKGQTFYGSLPQWMTAEDADSNQNLRYIAQIMSSYFDTLNVQIKALTSIKDKRYTQSSYKSPTFAASLLREKGFETHDMFLNADVFEIFSNVDLSNIQYSLNIDEIKNLIYMNIYNNLENIYSSKGTEKSVRNLVRCFGVDDELLKLNQYTDGGTSYLSNKYKTTSTKKKYINFNTPDHFSATIFQSGSRSFVSGSHSLSDAHGAAFTLEADIVVPKKMKLGQNGHFNTPFLSASVMGFHEANPTDNEDFTWYADSVGVTTASLGLSPFGTNEIIFRGAGYPTQFENMEIELISTDQTALTYEFTSSLPGGVSNGDVYNGNVIVDLGSIVANMATNFISAVDIAHSGKIDAFGGAGSNRVKMNQIEPGVAGNTNISSSLTDTTYIFIPSSFTGGTSTLSEARDLQVYLVRDRNESDTAKFTVKNEADTVYFESDWIQDIYDGKHMNVALRIKPNTYPFFEKSTNTSPNYTIEMYAVSHNFENIENEISASQEVNFETGSTYISAPKRIYAGAHYENFTGSIRHKTDVNIGRVTAMLDYVSNESIREHNKDVNIYGVEKSINNKNGFLVDNKVIPAQDLQILNWTFDTTTTSDIGGEFEVSDVSSGSSNVIYGWLDNITRKEHKGYGKSFVASSSKIIDYDFIYTNKIQLPETSFNSDNIFIKGDEEINFSKDDDVSDNLFVLEKSPSAIVSDEMLKMFSDTVEFANLFSKHVDRYRIEYKDLNKARQLFFENATTGIEFDKFFTYFKWIDSSVSRMIEQVIPASVNFYSGVTDVVESHILERSKYQRQIGLLKTVTSTEASIRGVQELKYNWKTGHAPLSGDENENCLWQKERKDSEIVDVLVTQNSLSASNPVFLSDGSETYEGRTYATRRFSRPYSATIAMDNSIHGGINYSKNKDRSFLLSNIKPQGEVATSGAPLNVVTFGAGVGIGLERKIDTCEDENVPNKKIKYDGFGMVGRFTDLASAGHVPISDKESYISRRKISHMFPGNIVSSSVNTGYASRINKNGPAGGYSEGVNVVNLHSDTTDITNEIPMQGPFSNQWVGGQQVRHVPIATGSQTQETRPESWRFLIGQNPLNGSGIGQADVDGAIGFTGPDYGGGYPIVENQKAIYFREERVKRFVSVKNIQTLTSSYSHGNYINEYEVMSTFGDQGYFLKRAGNLLPETISDTLPQTTNYHTLVARTTSVSGNYFGAENNRQPDGFQTFPTVQSSLSFRLHQDSSGIASDALDVEFNIERPDGTIVNFHLIDAGSSFVTGDISGGIVLIQVNGITNWVDVQAEIISGITDSTNAFGTDVIVTTSHDPSGKDGEEIIVTVTENSLVGSAGNGGEFRFRMTYAYAELLTPAPFSGGQDSYVVNVGNVIETQNRSTGSAHVIRTKFSAPGGPEINSSGYLDVATQQYSVHNSLNFRNLTIRSSGSGEDGTIRLNSHSNRRDGLQTLLSRHSGKFGIDSVYGAISESNYDTEASYHKQHRNASYVAKLGDFNNDGNETSGSFARYDNAFYTTPLPSSEFQYSWINNAVSGSDWRDEQKILGYSKADGLLSSSSGVDSAINFPESNMQMNSFFDSAP